MSIKKGKNKNGIITYIETDKASKKREAKILADKKRIKRRAKKKNFYGLVAMLVICTVLMLGALCAITLYNNGYFSFGGDVSQNVSEGKSKNPNIIIDIFKDKSEKIEEPEEIIEEVEEPKEITVVGARVWPLKDLYFYYNVPESSNEKSDFSISKGSRLIVKEEVGDYFLVEHDDEFGYIDSRYCLINLPDYLGDLLEYNIASSYSSVFMAHDYKLYGITGTVLPGYEEVEEAPGKYLVPYLYPCANKLRPIAERTIEDGYKLRIYDAFRPYKTTRFLYDTVESYMTKFVPLKDANGEEIVEFDEEGNVLFAESQNYTYPPLNSVVAFDGSLRLNDLTTIIYPAGTISEYPVGSMVIDGGTVVDPDNNILGRLVIEENGALKSIDYVPDDIARENGAAQEGEDGESNAEGNSEPKEHADETYGDVITGGKHRLGAFLAANGSAHNKGIALDLTLVDIETEEELPMQTAIHDLSYHSVIALNNDNANLLAKYMTEGGFNDLSSEWWHFQDDDTRNQLGIRFSLDEGVSP